MKQAKTDPRVSCPIVCGEYMRATGFFFATDTQTYLMTACHNLLPVNADNLATGNLPLGFRTTNFLPEIDMYLQDTDIRTRYRVDIRDTTGFLLDTTLDIIGIPIDLDPQVYGYTVWTTSDITPEEPTGTTIDTIGFPGRSFPSADDEYDTDQYAHQITNPYLLTLEPQNSSQNGVPNDTGLIGIGLDTDRGKQSQDYNGFSGSPVLGHGLVGIHEANNPVTVKNTETSETADAMMIYHWHVEALLHLLNQHQSTH